MLLVSEGALPMAADESRDDRAQSFVALTEGAGVSHNNIIEKIGTRRVSEVCTVIGLKLDHQVAISE